MTHEQVERERTFALAEGQPLPDLGGLLRTGRSQEHRLRAVYLDTPDLLLIRHRVTLRRREGGPDEGWHLKLPRPDGSRLEVHAPLIAGPGRTRVPAGHLRAVVAALGPAWPDGVAATLLPVATLVTDRTQTDVLDDRGAVVATLCDDRVTALPERRRWRELEVELAPAADDDDLLDVVAERFAAQGVQQSASPSKLARALGKRPDRAARGAGPRPRDPAAAVLHAHLATQVGAVLGREDDLRADVPDAVHRARVATRRLRSTLRTFDRLLDRTVTDPLREEVAWLAGTLGAPRDAEVVRERILTRLESLPADLVLGDALAHVRSGLDEAHALASAALVDALDSERYRRLGDTLVDLLADPPWRERAWRRADEVLPDLVRRSARKACRSVRRTRSLDDPGGPEALHHRHETRKRAKAVRYGWEALAPALGPHAAEAAGRWEEVTEALGELQDVVVARERMLELAVTAQEAGVPSFSLGVPVGEDRAQVPALMDRADRALDRALGA